MNKQSGFGIVSVLLILLAIGIVGFSGWKVWNRSSQSSPQASVKPVPDTKDVAKVEEKKPTAPVGFTLYQNKEIGFSFYYPEYWGTLSEKSQATSELDLESPDAPMNEHDNVKLFVWADKADNFVTRSTNKNITYKPSNEGINIIWKQEKDAYGIPAGTVSEYGPKVENAPSTAKIYGLQGGHSCAGDKQYLFQIDNKFVGIKIDYSGCFSVISEDESPEEAAKAEQAYNQVKDEIEKIPASIIIKR